VTDPTLTPDQRSLVMRLQSYSTIHIADAGRMEAMGGLVVKGYALAWGDETRKNLMLARATPKGLSLEL
jgi:hypothetical protein